MSVRQLRAVKKQDIGIGRAVNYDLEQIVLGTPLWLHANGHSEIAVDAMRLIANRPQDLFVKHLHRCLWSAMNWLTENRHLPSEAMIQQALLHEAPGEWSDDSNSQDQVTPGFLAELAEKGRCDLYLKLNYSPLFYLRQQLRQLSELRRRRRTTQALEEAQDFAAKSWHMKNDAEVGELLDKAISEFNERPDSKDSIDLFGLTAKRRIEAYEQIRPDDRIHTGFFDVDRLLNGFSKGNLVVIGGRTSQGKTALGLDFSLHAAKCDHVVVYCSLEMTKDELTDRIISKEMRINLAYLRAGQLTPSEREQIKKRYGEGSDLPIVLDDRVRTTQEITGVLRDLDRKIGAPNAVDLLVIDHIGLLPTRGQGKRERRDLEIAAHTATLKQMAKEREMVVILLSQLNRESAHEQRAPRLSDLRDSGALEQDCDVCIGIYRKFGDTKSPSDRNHAELHVLKNRNGVTGSVELRFIPEFARFIESQEGAQNVGTI